MNKADLVTGIAQASGMSRQRAALALESLLDVVAAALKSGDIVKLKGFGTFIAHRRPARVVRNPRTGAAMKVKATRTPLFRPSSELRDAVR